MKVKEASEKVGLKLNIKKRKIMASGPLTSWQTMEKQWKLKDFIFLGSKITADGDCSHEIKRCLLLGKKKSYDPSSSVQLTQLCPTLCDPTDRSTPGFRPSPITGACSNPCPLCQWCHTTTSSSVVPFSYLQSFPASGFFSNESVLCIRWPKYWSFSISPSNDYSGLISFRMDWLDLLAVQGTLKSLLQHHSSKASILQCSVFFIVQLLHPYIMTTGKTIALTRWNFAG